MSAPGKRVASIGRRRAELTELRKSKESINEPKRSHYRWDGRNCGGGRGRAQADAQASEGTNPDLDQIRALLRAHDEAFTNHDLKGVMACLTEKAAIMGTGPGEVWSGPDEIKVAYEHFFEGFDKGEQKFEYQFKIGGVTSEMGWLMTAGNVKGKRTEKTWRSLSISP